MKLGEQNLLKIARSSNIGLFLADADGNEVFLPNRFAPETFEIGAEMDVFIYNDSEGRIIATTLSPIATVNSFAFLECRDITDVGAFLDLGITKDLLVPHKNQFFQMEIGRKYLVWIYEDMLTHRLVGTTHLNRILMDNPVEVAPGDEVDILIWLNGELGYRAIVNDRNIGMVYHNQTFQPLNEGQRTVGYVNRVRDDGRIDLLLQRPGHLNIDESAKALIDALERNQGFLPLTDKSDPTLISMHLNMSKKSFKKAVGTLYKQRIISLEEKGIRLNP